MSDHTSNSPLKRCAYCKQLKPATPDYFYRSQSHIDGLKHYCKDCWASRSGHKRRAPQYLAVPTGHKRCTACGTVKLLSDFNKHAGHADGLDSKCRECNSQNGRAWYATHSDRAKQFVKRWKVAHREHVRRRDAASRKRRGYDSMQVKLKTHRRLARKKKLLDSLTAQDWQNALAYFGNRCAVCGRPAGLWHTLAMDHWIPLSDPNCPGTVPENIIPLCHGIDGCNNSKGDNDPVRWLTGKLGVKKARKILKRIQAYIDEVKRR